MQDNEAQPRKPPPEFPRQWSLAEVLKKPPPQPRPLIDGVIGDGGSITVLHGHSGDGKSYAALEMAFAITTGTPFVRMFPVPEGPQRVMLLDIDQAGRATQRRWYQRLGWPEVTQEQRDLVCANLFPFSDGVFDIGNREHRLSVKDLIGEKRINLLIVDTLAASLGSLNENEASTPSQYGTYIRSLQSVAARGDWLLSVIVVHHNRKSHPDMDDVRMEEEMRGSLGWRAISDYQLPLRRPCAGRLNLHLKKDRHGIEQDKVVQLAFENEQDEFGNVERWRIVPYAEGFRSPKTKGTVEAIQAIAFGRENAKTRKPIFEWMVANLPASSRPVNRSEFRNALEEAMALGVVVSDGKTARDPNSYQLFWAVK